MAKTSQTKLVQDARDLLERAHAADPHSPMVGEIEDAIIATSSALFAEDASSVRGFEGQFTTKKGEIEAKK